MNFLTFQLGRQICLSVFQSADHRDPIFLQCVSSFAIALYFHCNVESPFHPAEHTAHLSDGVRETENIPTDRDIDIETFMMFFFV